MRVGEEGMSILFVIMVSATVMLLAYILSSRQLELKKEVLKYDLKGQIADDRRVSLFDLANRPMPTPVP
jgi:hypothetical protein